VPSAEATATPAPPTQHVAAPRREGDGELAGALVRELRARGFRWREGDVVDARISLSLRKAPFAGSSALTADFDARAAVARSGRAPVRCEVSGHALEFAEPTVRAAARARAAEQLAACLTR
jgi:hypothetical protein